MAKDPRVDTYIEQAAPFAVPILTHLRALAHELIPDLDEAIKWGMPHFLYKGKNLAGLAAFKAHCAFVIHGDGRQGDAMGQYGKIARLEDIPSGSALEAALRDAMARIDAAGTALKPRTAPRAPKADLPVPGDFAAALAANPAAQATLDGFTLSQRREYVEWVVSAKRAETRASRIAQSVEWLAEGKKRNWKYDGC